MHRHQPTVEKNWRLFPHSRPGHSWPPSESRRRPSIVSSACPVPTTMSASAPQFVLRFNKTVSPHFHCASLFQGYPKCSFKAASKYPFHLPPQEIRVVRSLHDTYHTTVYLGRLKDKTEVALKFTDVKDIEAEAGVYDAMVDIQGTVIPKLYGVLYGRSTSGKRVACLVLERFGDALSVAFEELEKREKCVLLQLSDVPCLAHYVFIGLKSSINSRNLIEPVCATWISLNATCW